jgi:glucose/arabinose dehydrogenase
VNSVAVLPNGNIVASLPSFDSKIRLITMPSVAVSTLAGDSNQFADGALGVARFNDPRGLAVFPNGDIVVADSANHRIRLIASGVVSTLAGDGTTTILSAPRGVAVLSNGNIVVAGVSTNKIHLITMPGGVVSTLAGDGSTSIFHTPSGIAVLPNGNIVVSELNGNRIRLITMPGGVVSTLAGTSGAGAFVEGQGTLARFNSPRGLAVLPNGNIVVADGGNNRIRLITMPDGVVSTLAGDTATGTTNATGSGARFSGPSGVAVFPNGNIVVADTGNSLIRLIVPA